MNTNTGNTIRKTKRASHTAAKQRDRLKDVRKFYRINVSKPDRCYVDF